MLALALSGAALAGGLATEGFVGARTNPLGQTQELTVGWRQQLLPPDDLLRSQSYLLVGPKVQVTPAFASGGLLVRVMPLAIAQLQLHVERLGVWADQGAAVPAGAFPGSAATAEMAEAAGATMASGWRTTNHLLLQLKAGPIAARGTATLVGWRLDLESETFYDQAWDLVAPTQGWGGNLDLDLLVVADGQRPIAGFRYTLAAPLAVLDPWPGGAAQRVGPVVGWTFREKRPGGWVSQPTLFALAQWHLVHPWRSGARGALPQVGVGFSVMGQAPSDR